MSIVYDYLKQIKASTEPAKEVPKESPRLDPQPRPKILYLRSVKIALVLLLCAGVGAAVYYLAPRAGKPIVRLYHPVAASTNITKNQSSDPSYILEGIIYNPSQPFAIINGKMLETRNTIGEYEIMKITPDSVTLLNAQDKTTRTIHL